MRKFICLILIAILGFTFSGEAIGGGVNAVKNYLDNKETPIATDYIKKDNSNKAENSEQITEEQKNE